MATVNVEGVEELVAKLQGLAAKATGAQAAAALRAGALLIENDARQKAPIKTGTLRRSIHTNVETAGDGAVARIGTNVEYAIYLEMGTSRMRARPYLRPAFDGNRNQALAEIRRALQAMVTP